jgi:hypothetical protein
MHCIEFDAFKPAQRDELQLEGQIAMYEGHAGGEREWDRLTKKKSGRSRRWTQMILYLLLLMVMTLVLM